MLVLSPDTEEAFEAFKGLPLDPKCCTLVLNKADAFSKDRVLELSVRTQENLGLAEIINVSAKKGSGIEALKDLLLSKSKESGWIFEGDEISDLSLRQCAAEIVREKALLLTRNEVPHSVAVRVEAYREREDGLHEVEATLFVERESQKGIVIGKGGQMIKAIGQAARKDLERLAGARVFLGLNVKVEKKWKEKQTFLRELGISTGGSDYAKAKKN
jgi:GTP-binding protein Era